MLRKAEAAPLAGFGQEEDTSQPCEAGRNRGQNAELFAPHFTPSFSVLETQPAGWRGGKLTQDEEMDAQGHRRDRKHVASFSELQTEDAERSDTNASDTPHAKS